MLTTILSAIGLPFISKFFDSAVDIFKAYENKQISKEQAIDQLLGVITNAARDIEVKHAEVLAQTYATFMEAASKSILLQYAWCAAVYSQIFVLVWAQFFVPLLFAYKILPNWNAGTTADWAYLLVGSLLGLGPMVLRSGPAQGNIAATLRGVLGGK
jgi:hypothetical protein